MRATFSGIEKKVKKAFPPFLVWLMSCLQSYKLLSSATYAFSLNCLEVFASFPRFLVFCEGTTGNYQSRVAQPQFRKKKVHAAEEFLLSAPIQMLSIIDF